MSIGEPGFYGQIDVGNAGRPRLINSNPTVLERRYSTQAPVYLRVPPGQTRNWKRYCARYDACTRPVYFVRDDWYRDVYAPHYRNEHDNGKHDGDRGDRRDDRHDDDGREHRNDR